MLCFSGAAIARAGAKGPYQVTLNLKNAAGNAVMGQNYTTSAYSDHSFE